MNRRLIIFAGLLLSTLSWSGCGYDDELLPPSTFGMGLASDPETFDPGLMSGSVEGKVAYQIFEGLLAPAPDDGPPRPGVAERWEMSPDGITWTFHLRADARWSNGDRVVAEDFRYAWLRILRGDVAADYVSFIRYLEHARGFELMYKRFRENPLWEPFWASTIELVGVQARDDRTLVVRLASPTPYFADVVMFYTLFPVHRGSIEAHGQDGAFRAEHIVSNGAFRMDTYERRNRIRLVRNEHYWDNANVDLDEVLILIIEDNSARVTAYLDGRLDWADDPPANLLSILAAREDFHSAPQLGIYYYRFNMTDEVVSDRRIRHALSLAVNRAELCRCTLDDLYTPPTGFVPPIPGYEGVDMVRYDPQAARDLLAEAGYPGGEGFPTLSILYNTSENHRMIAQFIQDQWQVELGINVELVNQEWKVYLDTLEALDYQVGRAGWIGDYVDPNTFLGLWRSFDENNNTGWENAEYDALIARSLTETDPDRRQDILREAEGLLLTEMPVMPIYYYSQFHLVRSNVNGWEMNVRNVHLARWVSKEGG